MIKKGTFVRIKKVILEADERMAKLPSETQCTPFIMWTKGYLEHDSKLNDVVRIMTMAHRIEEGVLVEVEPMYKLDYGDFLEEILMIDKVIDDAKKK